jgi:hypothetical protein
MSKGIFYLFWDIWSWVTALGRGLKVLHVDDTPVRYDDDDDDDDNDFSLFT